jgi:uncharacterized protein YjbI with pentapeptide repeats
VNAEQAEFQHASLISTDLSDAWLQRAGFDDAILIQSVLDRSECTGASFKNVDMVGASCRSARLAGCCFLDARLIEADLQDADLSRAIISDVEVCCLAHAALAGADFERACVIDSDLHDADAHDANFTGADLRGVDLRGANLRGIEISGANLAGADLSRAAVDRPDWLTALAQLSPAPRDVHALQETWRVDAPATADGSDPQYLLVRHGSRRTEEETAAIPV